MPSYIISLKDAVNDEQIAAIKKEAVDQGGKITHEYTLIKAFAVSFPEGHVHTLDKNEHVSNVELDGEVKLSN